VRKMAKDNPKKDSKVEGKDNPKTWTPPEGQEWLLEKFSKAEKPTEAQAKAYADGEKQLREVEATKNKLETELNEIKAGGVTSFDEAMLAEKEDELAKLKAENEALRKPKSNLSAEQDAWVKDWHSKLVSTDPVVAAKAVQDAIAGEIYRYDQRKRGEEQKRSFNSQMEKVASTHTKDELNALAPYVYKIRKERPDLEKTEYGVSDILDKAKVRLAEKEKADREEEATKTVAKEQAVTTSPTGTTEVPVDWDAVMKLPTKEQEEYFRTHGIETERFSTSRIKEKI